MKRPPKLWIILAILAAAPISLAFGRGEEVTIKDTSGVTRAAAQVKDAGEVSFDLVGADGAPADGIDVTLVNPTTQETLKAVAVNGRVVFASVPGGTWTVASAVPGVTFTNVAVASTATLGGAGATAIAGAAGLGASAGGGGAALTGLAATGLVGGSAAAIGRANKNDDDDDDEGAGGGDPGNPDDPNNPLSPFQ